jgi:mannose-6-phosphate isomerase
VKLPVKISPAVLEKPWGSPGTEPWLAKGGGKIGEIWFSAPEAMPVLVKLLFTSEKLSVQVHPDDVYAQAHGEARGKTEMWHILRAEPDARIALGLRETVLPVSKEEVREAALSGKIVDMLEWKGAHAGDIIFVRAGTIHALGEGLVLCEIQQLSDVTYRLYDYQREPERPLHLDDALAVSKLEVFTGQRSAAQTGAGRQLLAECEYFRTERLNLCGVSECTPSGRPALYVAIEGQGRIAGQPFSSGDAWFVAGDAQPFAVESADAAFVIASA